MATLLTCRGVSKAFGTRELFAGLSVSFSDGERVGFLGPNGSGKTTFLKILAGMEEADSGDVDRRRSARIAYMAQDDRFDPGDTVESVLSDAIADTYPQEHDRYTQVNITLSKFGFTQEHNLVEALSGGWRKRLAVAREVIREPDLLLMDEPTNHLDMEGILWLEEMLLRAPFTFLVVSHDRYFLERVANRVVELNPAYPDGFFSTSGSYGMFLDKRADFLEAQQAQQVTLANIVRRESAFLKSQAKARRSKSKSRIDEAYRLKDELRDLSARNAHGAAAGIDFDSTGRKSRKLLEAKNLTKAMGGKPLFSGLDVMLAPGTRIGLLGSNGSGKTTLIRVLTGELEPDEGEIKTAENLRVVVFDQKRESVPQDIPLRRALSGDSDSVEFRGRPVHITAWAKRFLFSVSQLDMPVSELSGGEQARISVARLMLKPADVLVLDEPTNDLDISSLDVLEESLTEFPGAIVLVTHDRFMLDRICTEVIGLDGQGKAERYADCAQWQAAIDRDAKGSQGSTAKPARKAAKKGSKKGSIGGLTASEKSELRDIDRTIHDAEEKVKQCKSAMEDPKIASDHEEMQKWWDAAEAAKKHVESLYARWEELEERKG